MPEVMVFIETLRGLILLLAFAGFLWATKKKNLENIVGQRFLTIGFIFSVLAKASYLLMFFGVRITPDWKLVVLEVICHVLGVLFVFAGLLYWFMDLVRMAEAQKDLLRQARESEEALRVQEARYRGVVENQTEFITRFLPDGTLTFVNEAICRYVKKTPEELLGRRFYDFIPDEEGRRSAHHHSSVTHDNPSKSNYHRAIMPDGRVLWTHWNQRAIFDEGGQLIEFQSVGRDVTREKKMEYELQRLSLTDSLTGLANRTFFEMEMKRYEYEPSVGLMICDLDGLKLANDTLGHDFGDTLLIHAARLISSCCKNEEVVSRIGGDEFAILFETFDRDSIMELKLAIEAALEEYNRSNPEYPLSISVGFAVKDSPNTTMQDLFREADNNMYREKLYSARSPRSAIVKTLARALEARDFITQGHAARLQDLIVAMARAISMPENSLTGLKLFAQVHDVGKVGISDNILFKPGPLNSEEKREMQRHCEIGHRIALSSPDLASIADWILKHHEWWNGEGYPLGLKGEEIPIECRMLAIVDAFDAITNDRPYRAARSTEWAIAEIRRCAGTQFDPRLVEKFIQVIQVSDSADSP